MLKSSNVGLVFATMTLATMVVACKSPTSSCDCHNGVDCEGRGPILELQTSCVPDGPNEQCQAVRRESGYCATPPVSKDVTLLTQWSSSNPAVAMFTAPGLLRVLGAGVVVISAVQGGLTAESLALAVAPGSAPERMVHLQVSVADASVVTTNKWLLGATIDVTPERGPAQSCLSGGAIGSCDFWVFSGTVRIHASAAGYRDGDASAALAGAGAFSQYVKVSLAPV